MNYRQLGNSGLRISEISYGTWLTVGLGLNNANALACMQTALDNGINFIDTADIYNKGESETVIGKFLQNINRAEVIIGTKAFGPMSDHWMTQGLSYRHLRNACEASLKRLQTDYIDLYQCHRYDIDTPLEEVCFAMNQLILQGKILHWGVSQWTAVQITNAVRICEKNGWQKPISNQPIYNMLNRGLETDVMDVCATEGLGLVVYSPLSQGLLTGKYGRDTIPADSRAASEIMNAYFPTKRLTEQFFSQIDALKDLAKQWQVSMSNLALAWILAKQPITSCIIGASKQAQIIENVKASGIILDNTQMQQIEDVLNNAPVDQYTGARIGYGIIKRGY